MKYLDETHLSVPEAKELEALQAPLSLDRSSSLENSALARTLALESAAQCYIEPFVLSFAASPLWRLMCSELLDAAADQDQFRLLFLLASARMFVAGAEAERSSE